ncbi:MAG: carbon-nitrogen hydrolase [Bacteroidetes bacterium]|nr:carbon-nitrogen hydrolase [Bacteroidota bacterium]
MNASFLQFAPVLADLDLTISIIENHFKKLKNSNLLVLPELANSGYNFISKKMAVQSAEIVKKSKYFEFLIDFCKKQNIFIVSGFNEKEGSILYNSSILLGPKGYIGKYRKMHSFFNESKFFQKGNLGFPVFKTEIGNIGMLICYDWMFPEVWRILALKKADIICHPSNLVLPYAQQAVPVHALINKVFTITANRVGTEGNLSFTGKSLICNPLGEVLAHANEKDETICTAEIDISIVRNKKITPKNHIFKDRRIDEYGELFK